MKACRRGSTLLALLGAALLLTAVAWLRGAEYDEQYTLFLTGGVARPTWPADAITAGEVRALQAGHAGLAAIAHDLRTTDVHPPLYFWLVDGWRGLVSDALFVARLASVLCSIVTLALIAATARWVGIAAAPAVLLTVGCYGFAYTGAIARGFALAQMLSVAGVALLVASRRRPFAAGALLGAATFANYLAVFVACAGVVSTVIASSTPGSGRSALDETGGTGHRLPSWPGSTRPSAGSGNHLRLEGDGRVKPGHDGYRRAAQFLVRRRSRRSNPHRAYSRWGLLRRSAPRNDTGFMASESRPWPW